MTLASKKPSGFDGFTVWGRIFESEPQKLIPSWGTNAVVHKHPGLLQAFAACVPVIDETIDNSTPETLSDVFSAHSDFFTLHENKSRLRVDYFNNPNMPCFDILPRRIRCRADENPIVDFNWILDFQEEPKVYIESPDGEKLPGTLTEREQQEFLGLIKSALISAVPTLDGGTGNILHSQPVDFSLLTSAQLWMLRETLAPIFNGYVLMESLSDETSGTTIIFEVGEIKLCASLARNDPLASLSFRVMSEETKVPNDALVKIIEKIEHEIKSISAKQKNIGKMLVLSKSGIPHLVDQIVSAATGIKTDLLVDDRAKEDHMQTSEASPELKKQLSNLLQLEKVYVELKERLTEIYVGIEEKTDTISVKELERRWEISVKNN